MTAESAACAITYGDVHGDDVHDGAGDDGAGDGGGGDGGGGDGGGDRVHPQMPSWFPTIGPDANSSTTAAIR